MASEQIDGYEQIEKCLNCQFPECKNCIVYGEPKKKDNTKIEKSVITYALMGFPPKVNAKIHKITDAKVYEILRKQRRRDK